MLEDERVKVIKELKCVDEVILSIDKDRTVCKTLEKMEPKPDFFVMEETKITTQFPKSKYVIKEI